MVTVHIICIFFSGAREVEDYYHVTIVAICSLLASSVLNLWNDKKLRQAANYVNN